MNDQPKSIWNREILPEAGIFRWPGRFRRSFFTRRNLRRMVILLAWTATLVALFYGEEHWRGRRAWTQYRQELERRGEQLDLKAFIPKPVPDEQNFAATPFIRSWFERMTNSGDQWKDDFAQADKLVLNQKLDESRRHFVDLTAWAAAFDAVHSAKAEPADQKTAFGARYGLGLKKGEVVPTRPESRQKLSSIDLDLETRSQAAPAVLEGLKSSEAVLAELRAASARPASRFPVNYNMDNPWAILLPHLAQLKGVCRRLDLRACAELAAGQSAQALDDLTLMLYVADSVKGEPFLISYLVRLSCLKIATRTVWEGLAEHRWTDSQLKVLQDRLTGYNLLSDLKQPLATERAAAILTVDLLTRGKYNLNDLGDFNQQPETGSALPILTKIIPSGWFYLERLNYCLSFDSLLNGTMDSATQRIWPDRVESNLREFERQLFGGRFGRRWNMLAGHRIITALLLPALGNVTHKTANAQTTVNQAIIACALERYRLVNGNFPEKLEAIMPQFVSSLPHDVINGEPFHYRRGEGNQVTLYSVGWNLHDQSARKSLFEGKEGDWVWEYPQKASNPKAKPLE